jgi:hypothetical protein
MKADGAQSGLWGRVRATQEDDLPRVQRLLSDALNTPRDRPFLLPDALRWKYFEPREDWPGPRSFVLAENEAIVAHIALWPFTLLLPNGPIQTVQAIDWARARNVAGAGSLLRRSTLSLTPVQVGIGGTRWARQAREKSGFRPWTEFQQWTLVCRPWLRFWVETRRDPVRASGRLLRALKAGLRHKTQEQSWRCANVDRFGEELDPFLPAPGPDRIARGQSAVSLNYLLDCPQVRCQGFHLRRKDELRGYVILARTSPWARIVTLHVREASSNDLEAAYAAAVAAALEDSRIWGVTTDVSCPKRQTALARASFRRGCTTPVALLDPGNLIDPTLEVDLQMSESDVFSL